MSANAPTLTLTGEENAELEALVDALPTFDINRLDEPLLDQLHEWTETVPSRLAAAVTDLRAGRAPHSAIVIRNLPVDPTLPETPLDGRPAPTKQTRVSEYVLLLLASLAGEPIGYEEEKEGLLVHDVCPKPGSEHKQENTGSVFFDLHTENAFHPLTPDLLSLLCLRGDRDGAARTLVASAREIVEALRADHRDVLREPLFRTKMPTSFSADPDAGEVLSEPKPVVSGSDADPKICIDSFNTKAATRQAEEALDEFVRVLRSKLDGWPLEPGDLLMVDNRRAVHARTQFTPRYDGRDRWLQRTYTVCDPEKVDWIRSAGTHVCSGLPALATTAYAN